MRPDQTGLRVEIRIAGDEPAARGATVKTIRKCGIPEAPRDLRGERESFKWAQHERTESSQRLMGHRRVAKIATHVSGLHKVHTGAARGQQSRRDLGVGLHKQPGVHTTRGFG